MATVNTKNWIKCGNRKFNPASVAKSKTVEDLIKRYKVLYPDLAETKVREIWAAVNGKTVEAAEEAKTEKPAEGKSKK